jgi:SagB-type dehydrogenase family enzyme
MAYAPGPEAPDWDSQPAAFRHYRGSPTIALPLSSREGDFRSPPSGSAADPASPSLRALGALLQLSLAITAWKRSGRQQWSVRANPSSGNLHPVEGYVIATGFPDLGPGLYHYNPLDHSLELRAEFHVQSPRPSLFVGISILPWRESWKYGSRAFRYCVLDTGHAAAAVAYGASVLGWRAERKLVSSDALDSLLGLDRMEHDPLAEEREHSELLLEIDLGVGETRSSAGRSDAQLGSPVARWHGTASPIASGGVRSWPLVEDALKNSAFTTPGAGYFGTAIGDPAAPDRENKRSTPSVETILGRRSAQQFDPNGPILSSAALQRILRATLPEAQFPWGSIVAKPRIHFALFILRVEGLQPGIYLFPRTAGFTRPGPSIPGSPLAETDPTWPADLPIILLAPFDVDTLSERTRELLCRQDLAGKSMFAVAMLGEFDAALAEDGGHGYRSLHHEAGVLGQVLYLETEAARLQGTGIGCFFDDAVYEALGLFDERLQPIYHFCVGNPVPDHRIKIGVPYPNRPPADAKT